MTLETPPFRAERKSGHAVDLASLQRTHHPEAFRERREFALWDLPDSGDVGKGFGEVAGLVHDVVQP